MPIGKDFSRPETDWIVWREVGDVVNIAKLHSWDNDYAVVITGNVPSTKYIIPKARVLFIGAEKEALKKYAGATGIYPPSGEFFQ